MPAILVALVAPAVAAEGPITATLEYVAETRPTDSPYLKAKLTVSNGQSTPIGAVRLRSLDGGAGHVTPITVRPTSRAGRTIRLPATSPEQTFAIEAFDRSPLAPGASILGRCTAQVHWPTERIDARRFLNADAAGGIEGPTDWPAPFRRKLLCAAGIVALIALGIGMIPNRTGRAWTAAVAGTVILAATVYGVLKAAPIETQRTDLRILQRPVEGATTMKALTIITSRRTTRRDLTLTGRPWRVYADRAQMQADRDTFGPTEIDRKPATRIACKLRAGETKVFVANVRMTPKTTRPAQISLAVNADGTQGLLEANRGIGRSVWIIGDQVARVDAMTARTPRTIDLSATQTMAQLRAKPERFGLDRQSLKLFEWWDRTDRDVEQAYLAWPDAQHKTLYVSTVNIGLQ